MSLYRRVALSVIESRTKSLAMRRIAFLFLLFPFVLSAQQDCDVFNIQGLAAENLALHDSIAQFSVDSIILQPDGSYQVHLSNGTTYTQVQGCTDPAYIEYDAIANTDDGSCASSSCSSVEFNGHTYSVVEIGDQCWFAENLRTTVYADGGPIPEVTGYDAWAFLISGARCDYENDATNVATFGRLYNWYAVDDAGGLCPSGWHVPTDGEWTDLKNYINSQGFAGAEGTALKSTSGWNSGGNGTDDFGFSALPGGYRSSYSGYFYEAGNDGAYWSSSFIGGAPWYRHLYDNYPDIIQDHSYSRRGFSVRCLRDAD